MPFLPILSLPGVAFWILIFIGRSELRQSTLRIFVAIWAATLAVVVVTKLHGGYFTAVQALLDCCLIIAIFGRDIQIR